MSSPPTEVVNLPSTDGLAIYNRAPLKTALKRENEIIVPRARRGSESVLAHGEEA